ncbi:MAG: hypothetical protein JNL19_12405 [Burkholderiales bacterium]|nr:hypothetical protein [Burkholderiales bacterium]
MTKRVKATTKPQVKATSNASVQTVVASVTAAPQPASSMANETKGSEKISLGQLAATLGLPPSYLYLSGYLYTRGYTATLGIDADLFPRSADTYIVKAFDPFMWLVAKSLPDVNLGAIMVVGVTVLLAISTFAIWGIAKWLRKIQRVEKLSAGMAAALSKPSTKSMMQLSLAGLLLASVPYLLVLILATFVLPAYQIGAQVARDEVEMFLVQKGCAGERGQVKPQHRCVTISVDNGTKTLATGLPLISSDKAIVVLDMTVPTTPAVRMFVLDKGMNISRNYGFTTPTAP